MASLRVQLSQILETHQNGHKHAALKEVVALVERLTVERKPCAAAYNLAGDLMMEQSLRLADPHKAKLSVVHAVTYYEKAVELAPTCVDTAAAHGAALLALHHLDLAEVELRRGMAIRTEDSDHPFIHHIKIKGGTKDQLIADAKRRIEADLAYIRICRGDRQFEKILKQLDNPKAQPHTILNAARKLAEELQDSVRAKFLYPQVVLALLSYGQWKGQDVGMVVESALTTVRDLTVARPNSLVFSLSCARFLIKLGFFDAAEKEFRRAMSIENPDDPRDHDIPLGYTHGVRYTDRVLLAKEMMRSVLSAMVDIAHHHFEALAEDTKSQFLSVRAAEILENNENGLVNEALDYYRANSSWVSWRCPRKSNRCPFFIASTPSEFLEHVCQHANDDVPGVLYHNTTDKLMECTYVPNDEPHCGLYLAKDAEGNELVCIKQLKYLFKGITDVLVGGNLETISPDAALASFQDQLSTVDVEDANAVCILENLWLELLRSSASDKREALMRLIATIKWEEVKEIIEKQIAEAEIPRSDLTIESEKLINESIQETKDSGKETEKPSCHHAFMYGHGALHRRLSVINAVSSAVKTVQKEEEFDPYDNRTLHREYVRDLPHVLPHLVLCSACYFEKDNNLRCAQILHHFSYVHHSTGVRCPIYSVRFIRANALAYHMDYCHDVNPVKEQVIEEPG